MAVRNGDDQHWADLSKPEFIQISTECRLWHKMILRLGMCADMGLCMQTSFVSAVGKVAKVYRGQMSTALWFRAAALTQRTLLLSQALCTQSLCLFRTASTKALDPLRAD